jgi:DNA-binding NarL/FixJ family response regulator
MDIAVVGPHSVVRVGLRLLVEAHPGWRVVAEAADTEGLARLSMVTRPDVVVIDVDPPSPSPGRILTRIAGRFPGARLVAIGTADGSAQARRALTAGACEYVAKDAVDTLLIAAIELATPQPST